MESIPLGKCVLDILQCGIEEYTAVISDAQLDANSVVNETILSEGFVCNSNC